jgi:hypothetical protein
LDDASFGVKFINTQYIWTKHELSFDEAEYHFSNLICANPLVGCEAALTMLVHQPEVDKSWLIADMSQILILQNDELLDAVDSPENDFEVDDLLRTAVEIARNLIAPSEFEMIED